ncbi:hypothetical protein [Actinoplanes sp. NBRC 101535]|uniref:hypothetical protein n=1 Tax=Actinoplanes sp. NBRC 101535 TaxID=3032196 RepID=UPI0024A1DE96|nr:hypothetical protein [Actinoplanes sp. NBRC 101535]GLY08285.1 hypothetical protein Acsp01_86640 [Actinoplanes sp. NBRC 101535]
MSRHTVPADTDGIEIIVGWDVPQATFFAQAWDRRRLADDPAAELVWIGTEYREIQDPQTVLDAIKPWATIPEGLADTLYQEAHA